MKKVTFAGYDTIHYIKEATQKLKPDSSMQSFLQSKNHDFSVKITIIAPDTLFILGSFKYKASAWHIKGESPHKMYLNTPTWKDFAKYIKHFDSTRDCVLCKFTNIHRIETAGGENFCFSYQASQIIEGYRQRRSANNCSIYSMMLEVHSGHKSLKTALDHKHERYENPTPTKSDIKKLQKIEKQKQLTALYHCYHFDNSLFGWKPLPWFTSNPTGELLKAPLMDEIHTSLNPKNLMRSPHLDLSHSAESAFDYSIPAGKDSDPLKAIKAALGHAKSSSRSKDIDDDHHTTAGSIMKNVSDAINWKSSLLHSFTSFSYNHKG
ncbi:MAG: hypothetical protein ACPGEF_02935 [Endozoicomonas sp.]